MQSVERLRADPTQPCRDAAVSPTAGEEFPPQLQHLTEDLFSVVVFFFFIYKYTCFSELESSEFASIKKLFSVCPWCEWRRAHLQQSAR